MQVEGLQGTDSLGGSSGVESGLGRLTRSAGSEHHRCLGCDNSALMMGPDPHVRCAKRVWEGSVQQWRRDIRHAAAVIRIPGFQDYLRVD